MNTYIKDDKSCAVLATSYHKSDMKTFIKLIPITERITYYDLCLSQLCHALLILFHHNILHRDIKPENILMDYDDNNVTCYLADFGLSYQLPCNGNNDEIYFSLELYTGFYRPPEVFIKDQYDYSADIWALGIVLMEYLTGQIITNIIEYSPGDDEHDIVLPGILATTSDTSPDRLTSLKQGLLTDHVHVDKYVGNNISTNNILILESMLKFLPTDRIHITKLIQGTHIKCQLLQMPLRKFPIYFLEYSRYQQTTKWMVDVAKRLELSIRALICAIDIRDRYGALYKITGENDLLISIGCIIVADRMITDVNITDLDDYMEITNNIFTLEQLMSVQQDIMKAMNYLLVSCEIDDFVNVLEKFPNINNVPYQRDIIPQPKHNDVFIILDNLYQYILSTQKRFISEISYQDMITIVNSL